MGETNTHMAVHLAKIMDAHLLLGVPLPRHVAHMICNPDEDYIWRIEEHLDGSVQSMYIGFCPIDSRRNKTYMDYQDVPEWMKDRVAVLRMMPPDPNKSVVFGVGRRISENIFWVVE